MLLLNRWGNHDDPGPGLLPPNPFPSIALPFLAPVPLAKLIVLLLNRRGNHDDPGPGLACCLPALKTLYVQSFTHRLHPGIEHMTSLRHIILGDSEQLGGAAVWWGDAVAAAARLEDGVLGLPRLPTVAEKGDAEGGEGEAGEGEEEVGGLRVTLNWHISGESDW